MKKIQKIISLGTLTASLFLSPIVACSKTSFSKIHYDFGIAIPPVSNLNYVKFPFLNSVLPTLVQGIGQEIGGETLKNQMKIPKFHLQRLHLPAKTLDNEGGLFTMGSEKQEFLRISQYGTFAGILKSGKKGARYVYNETTKTVSLMALSLHGLQKWKGAQNPVFNRVVVAQDFIDFVKYVGDINVGSKKEIEIRELKIRGFEEFIIAQKNYLYKYGKTYKNPWGLYLYITKESNYKSFKRNWQNYWPQQNHNDKKMREAIKNAALEFLLEGMRLFPPGISENSEDRDFSETDFFIQFRKSQSKSEGTTFGNIQSSILPINKDFVESIGGIEKFGTTFDKWLYTSPFNITDIRLGQGGYIDLEKDDKWIGHEYTVPRKIKIYFNQNPNILATMFDDKYISATDIPAIHVYKLWSSPKTRQFMSKRTGFGTLSLQMNLDKETNGDSPLQNLNFRKAIAHSINRGKLLKLLNWEFSFPVTTWTLLSKIYASDLRTFDDFAANEYFHGPFNSRRTPLTSSQVLEHDGRRWKFESSVRKDVRFNSDEAWKYYEEYVKETGDSEIKTLVFLSANPQGSDAALGIQTMLNQSLKNKVKIRLKSVPTNSYEIMRQKGEFDLTTYNFDAYGSSIDSYIKRLFIPDEIDSRSNKERGFINNPTGSWTFYQWYLENANKINLYEKYLEVPKNSWKNKVWNKVKELVSINPQNWNKNNLPTLNKKLTNALENIWGLSDDLINTVEKQFYFVILLEKIIALTAPIIPLMDVDNAWFVSRIYGLSNPFSYSLQFTYDVLNKPFPGLPGKDIWLNEKN